MEPIIDADKPVKTEMQKLEDSFTKLYNDHMTLKTNFTKAVEHRNKLMLELKSTTESNQKLSQKVLVLCNRCELYEKIIEFVIEKCE